MTRQATKPGALTRDEIWNNREEASRFEIALRGWWNDRIRDGWPFANRDQFVEGEDWRDLGEDGWPRAVSLKALETDFLVTTGREPMRNFPSRFYRATYRNKAYRRMPVKVEIEYGVYLHRSVPFVMFDGRPSMVPL